MNKVPRYKFCGQYLFVIRKEKMAQYDDSQGMEPPGVFTQQWLAQKCATRRAYIGQLEKGAEQAWCEKLFLKRGNADLSLFNRITKCLALDDEQMETLNRLRAIGEEKETGRFQTILEIERNRHGNQPLNLQMLGVIYCVTLKDLESICKLWCKLGYMRKTERGFRFIQSRND